MTPYDIYGVWTIAPEENCPPDNCPLDDCLPDYCPRTVAPEDNCAERKLPRDIYPLGKLPPDNCPPDNCPLEDCSRKITPKIIAHLTIFPWKLAPRKIVFRIFVAYIIPPRKTATRMICPKDKLHTVYFSPRIRNRSILVNSSFHLFSFFVV